MVTILCLVHLMVTNLVSWKLHMGMYSVTALGPTGYAPAFSGDFYSEMIQ